MVRLQQLGFRLAAVLGLVLVAAGMLVRSNVGVSAALTWLGLAG